MSTFQNFAPVGTNLARRNTLAEGLPGQTRWVANKGADQSGHVDTENIDGTGHWEIYAYNATGGALTVGAAYNFVIDGDEETNPQVIAYVDGANTNLRRTVWATEATAATSWGWFAYAGVYDVLVEGTTDVAKDDFLKFDLGVSVTALIKDGTAETDNSFACACAAQAANSAVLTRCHLIGDRKATTT